MKSYRIFLLLFPSICFSNVYAEDPSYSNARFGYVSGDIVLENITGISLKGSYSLTNQIYIHTTINDIEYQSFDIGFNRYLLGLGYHRDILNGLHFQGSAAYVVVDGDTDTNSGYEAALGLRKKVWEYFDVGVEALYVDVGNRDGTSGYRVSTRWLLSENWSLGILYRDLEEIRTAVFDVGFGF